MSKPKDKLTALQSPRGTHDILPQDQRVWEMIRATIRELSAFYGFERIDTPHFEHSDLFSVGVGTATDIVSKQMYSFKTRGGDQLTLRPEGTAAIARAYVEHGMINWPQPVKLHYVGSFFRHEAPQRGRFRELHQWGLELLGDESAVADAEVIQLFRLALAEWGLSDIVVEVNSVGCPTCRPAYRSQLTQFYRSRVRGLCRDCKDRFRENPLRLLDCKEEKCSIVKKSSPQFLDRLCEPCRNHFKLLLEFLEEMDVPYALNPHLVRGLDYYTRTVFEVFVEGSVVAAPPASNAEPTDGLATPVSTHDTGRQQVKKLAVLGGGRYDGLIELVGGRATPAVGGALGLDRLAGLLKERNARLLEPSKPEVFLVQLGDLAKKKSFRLMEELRKAGISMAESLGRDSIRSQLKVADRVGASFALILGQKEALDDMVIIREMASGIQETMPQAKLIETLKRKFRH